MSFHSLDLKTNPRKDHFAYFNQLAYPYVGVTVSVDITAFYRKIKARSLPFFLSFCYCAARAANAVPELRQRIREGQILEFDDCPTSHTVALDDGTYCYCTLHFNCSFSAYLPAAIALQQAAKQARSISENAEDSLDKLFISTLPWLNYTSLVQPVPCPADSNPRITWGKFTVQPDQVTLPVSILCHHALADGSHLAAFYQALDQQLANLAAEL